MFVSSISPPSRMKLSNLRTSPPKLPDRKPHSALLQRGLNEREREVVEDKWKGTSGRISSKKGGGYQNRCRDMDVMTGAPKWS
jgi:hypothetical protein